MRSKISKETKAALSMIRPATELMGKKLEAVIYDEVDDIEFLGLKAQLEKTDKELFVEKHEIPERDDVLDALRYTIDNTAGPVDFGKKEQFKKENQSQKEFQDALNQL